MSDQGPVNEPRDFTLRSNLTVRNRFQRFVWGLIWLLMFRPSPRLAYGWRAWLLRRFGARVGRGTKIYNSVKFFLPANAIVGDYVVIGPDVDFYCVAPIEVGQGAIVSQDCMLCAATHDFRDPNFPLVTKPITIGDGAWICAQAFIGPGVTVARLAVVGARAAVFKDVGEEDVVVGNPAKFLKKRYAEQANSLSDSP